MIAFSSLSLSLSRKRRPGSPRWECSRLPFPSPCRGKGYSKALPESLGGLGGSTRDCLLTLPVEEKAISRGQNSGLRGLFSLLAEEKALQSVGSFQEPARRIKNLLPVDETGFLDRLREAQRAGRGLDGSARDCMFTLPVEEKAIPRGQIHTRFEIGVLAKCRFPVPVDLFFVLLFFS